MVHHLSSQQVYILILFPLTIAGIRKEYGGCEKKATVPNSGKFYVLHLLQTTATPLHVV